MLLLTALELTLRCGHCGYPTSFFIEGDTAGTYVTNCRFGWRFFPPAIARVPEPHQLCAKPAGTIRIFILGESAALGVPNPDFGFGRILEAMLRERHPSVRFEVVNAAMTAINSHGVLDIARDCGAFEPDLFVVYMGNNEVVGPYGPGTVFQDWSPSRPLIRATLRARSTRTGQLLAKLVRALHPDRAPKTWRGMAMAMDRPVTADDPRLIPTYENFRQNLAEIVQIGRRAGAAVVVATVPVNLRDCPPFASRHRSDLQKGELSAWESIYRAGIELQGNRRWREALDRYDLAARLDDRFAELQFRVGECLSALGRLEEARVPFLDARDLDVLRFRADRKINAVVRDVCAAHGAHGLYLADAERALAASASATGGLPGADLFFEHVHLTFDGNYLVARALLEQVERALPQLAALRMTDSVPSKEQCAQALTMTPWDEHVSLERVVGMVSPPPFSSQPGHAARMAALRQWTESVAGPSSLAESRRLYEAAVAKAPGDWRLHYRYGQLLLDAGEPQMAAGQMRAALKACPWNVQIHVDLGKVESVNGRYGEAAAQFQKALDLYPYQLAAHSGLVAALARDQRIDEATAHLRKALGTDPHFNGGYIALGTVLDEQGDAEGAIAQFRRALEIDPEDPVAHQSLGATLAKRGSVDEAVASFRKALDLNPALETAHLNLGMALASQGNLREAEFHFRAAQEIKPADPLTYYYLGSSLASRGRTDEAIAQFRKTVELAPGDYDAHISLGIALTARGSREAVAHFQQAQAINPENPVAYYNLGVALAGQGRAAEAAAQFRRTLDLSPNDAAAHLGLGKTLADAGRLDEAIAHVQSAVDSDPENAMAYFVMGQLLAMRGRIGTAIASYERALQIRPEFTDARRRLLSLRRAGGRP